MLIDKTWPPAEPNKEPRLHVLRSRLNVPTRYPAPKLPPLRSSPQGHNTAATGACLAATPSPGPTSSVVHFAGQPSLPDSPVDDTHEAVAGEGPSVSDQAPPAARGSSMLVKDFLMSHGAWDALLHNALLQLGQNEEALRNVGPREWDVWWKRLIEPLQMQPQREAQLRSSMEAVAAALHVSVPWPRARTLPADTSGQSGARLGLLTDRKSSDLEEEVE